MTILFSPFFAEITVENAEKAALVDKKSIRGKIATGFVPQVFLQLLKNVRSVGDN